MDCKKHVESEQKVNGNERVRTGACERCGKVLSRPRFRVYFMHFVTMPGWLSGEARELFITLKNAVRT